MQLYNIAVYQPANSTGATWKKVSSWAANEAPENMVFMNNLGGGASGVWTSEFALLRCSDLLSNRTLSQFVVETVSLTLVVIGAAQSPHPTLRSIPASYPLGKRSYAQTPSLPFFD